tara:strand:- start:465 stop:2417 length:1953 start_codon:yes stop_codon:yes gene_type:complete
MRRLIYLLALFAPTLSAQCESIGIGGTHYQIIMTLPLEGEAPDYWETSALDGTIIDQDSDGNNNHFAFNDDLYDNIVTCIYFADTVCCAEYFYDENDGWVPVVPITPQCDLSITSWDASTGDVVIEAINSLDCGCNELTNEDNTCDNSPNTHINNNTTVSHIVLGLHSPGLDYNWLDCLSATYHPGWTFKVFTLYGNQVLDSGDTWSANVYNTGASTNDCWAELLANDTLCMELAIWQINLSQTATTDIGGWAVNPNTGNQTQNYPDVNLSDNSVITCAPPEDDVTELLYIDLECDLYCDETGAYYNAILFFDNVGNTTITNFCINYDVLSGPDVIECFEGELPPGESVTMECGPITSDGGGGVIIRLETLEGEETDITWAQPIACYFDATTTCIFGCTDPEASNYDPNAEWDDGTCNYDIYGCTDATAFNYNPDANVDDGSCIYDIPGCTDPTANNFNPLATINDGSCTYDILGCTDPNALNYNPAANVDDGSCEYPIPGCTDPAALNYNEFATVEDGSCEYLEGCTDLEAINYNSLAILDDGSCVYPPEDCDGEYFVPNTFTPNNDGYNDGWKVTVADEDCWKEWNVQIYNRWGSLVWESSTLGETWPASVGDGHYYVADGVYVYRVYGVGWNPLNTFTATGHITIFK